MFLIRIFLIIALFFNTTTVFALSGGEIIDLLTFDDLVELSKTENPEEELQQKLDKVLYTPIVNNTIAPETSQLNNNALLGDFIRVASWNISRGRNIDLIKMLFNDTENFYKRVDEKKLKKVKEQIEILKSIDILLVNEADIGMPRTRYKNIPEQLAEILKFNYAFGVEFLEVDPTHLDLEEYEWSEEKMLYPDEEYIIDKEKYKGLHGNIILSRFPLKNVRILRLPNQYDWFKDEHDRVVEVEYVRRKAASLILSESIFREIRRGGRMAVIADVEIPGMKKPLTVVAVHLENRTVSKNRYKQLKPLLEEIQLIENPLVFGGDFNTTTADGRPTSFVREVKKKLTDPTFMTKQVINVLVPQALIINITQFTTNLTRKYKNPTVFSVPILSPNDERKLFSSMENLVFCDGLSFDFSGDRYRSTHGRWGMLSSSNERSIKGFKSTYMFERDFLIGKFKLDWIFVKPGEDSFSPFFGRTLHTLNYSTKPPVSDHVPITVDLPLDTPTEDEFEQRKKDLKLIIKELEKVEI